MSQCFTNDLLSSVKRFVQVFAGILHGISLTCSPSLRFTDKRDGVDVKGGRKSCVV